MYFKILCCLTYLTVFYSKTAAFTNEVDFEGWLNIRLEHCLSNTPEAEFTERGNVSIHAGTTSFSHLPLSETDKNKLQILAKEDKFYRLKAIVINSDGSEIPFLTSIKACMLAQSGLTDYLSISLDHSNNVVGISIGAESNACQGSNVPIEKLAKFNTKAYVMPTNIGPIPDTASYIQKLEREREAKERGNVPDNRSFLSKYWMYIIPVVLIMVLSSAANPDGAAGGNGRAQGS